MVEVKRSATVTIMWHGTTNHGGQWTDPARARDPRGYYDRRGPLGNGVSDETKAPIHWSGTENIAWKTAIPGVGHSSPVVWGKRIFLTAGNPARIVKWRRYEHQCLDPDSQRREEPAPLS